MTLSRQERLLSLVSRQKDFDFSRQETSPFGPFLRLQTETSFAALLERVLFQDFSTKHPFQDPLRERLSDLFQTGDSLTFRQWKYPLRGTLSGTVILGPLQTGNSWDLSEKILHVEFP
ncbi:hypothetical protein AVEN_233464-1 [Araneus ventricosus]|uniref:Uncharacterized protein n=1 Tax=Araneus ventricosus TaxID=182803 RepID=A0A4Y2ESM2_ARAVE|nr:hypothetical protein AVEN_233464-1 [Araneus ventricosus]